MPKVLRIINRFNLGGITYNVAYLTKYLAPEFETLLIGGAEEDGEESSLHITDNLHLKPRILPELQRAISFKSDYLAYKKIKEIIHEFKPDIVHTHASKAGAVGRLAAIHCKVPIIVHTFHGHVFHSYFGTLKTNLFKIIERYLAKRTNAIIAISEIQKNELVNQFKICTQSQTHVIPLGFDLDRFQEHQSEKRKDFRTKYNLEDNEIAIGIVGRLVPIKNHELFIESMVYASKNCRKKIRGFIIGDGETRQALESYLKTNGYHFSNDPTNKVLFTFTSWIKNMDWALAGLDLVALTSKNEGTPVSLIEAQAAGKFIISTNVGGTADVLLKDSGFISEATDSKTYKENLVKAITNFNELSAKASENKEQITKKFSYKRLVSDMEKLYLLLLKNKK